MEESLERELRRAQRRESRLAVVAADLDYFKALNDTFGHHAGDAVLQHFGRFLEANVRAEDIACRHGGEEFTLILPDATPEQAMRRADELRVGLSAMRVESRGESLASVTASFGVAGFPLHGATAEGLLAAANKALYRAKGEGRNRVVVAEPPLGDPDAQVSTAGLSGNSSCSARASSQRMPRST